jgi:hypothetical protein
MTTMFRCLVRMCPSPRAEPTRQLLRAPTYKGHKDVTGIIENMAPVHSGFHKQKNFSENYEQFGHAPT